MTAVRLYHGSADPLEAGTVLVSSGGASSGDPDVEALIERFRPESAISREEAVFGSIDVEDIDPAGGYVDNVHVVETQVAELSDLAWLTEAQSSLYDGLVDRAEVCAREYWSGRPYHDPDASCFEVRMAGATVVRVTHPYEDDLVLYGAGLSDATYGEVETHTSGSCHHLAIALHRLHGWALEVYVEPFDDYVCDDGTEMPSVCHVFAEDGEGRLWDVTGWRSANPREVLRRNDLEVVSFSTEAEFVEAMVSAPGRDRPLDAMTAADIERATALAERIVSSTPVETFRRPDTETFRSTPLLSFAA